MKYLLIEGKEFDIALRAKKLDEHFLSCNYPTEQQISIRREDGVFPWMAKPTVQIFLGHRLTDGLQKALSHIVLTFESRDPRTGHRRAEWIEFLWTAQDGIYPVRDTQDSFLAPPAPPKLRPKKTDKRDKDAGNDKSSAG